MLKSNNVLHDAYVCICIILIEVNNSNKREEEEDERERVYVFFILLFYYYYDDDERGFLDFRFRLYGGRHVEVFNIAYYIDFLVVFF